MLVRSAVAIEVVGGALAGILGTEVDGAADAVGVLVGGEGLVDLDGLDEVGGYDVQADLANGGLGRGKGDAVDGDVGEAGLGAADLDVDAFALDAVEGDGGQAADGVGDVGVGKAADDLSGENLEDVVGGAGGVDSLSFAMGALGG